jgi:hypothetical protein
LPDNTVPKPELGNEEDEEKLDNHRENFKSWYVDILEGLYPDREAGFVILMVAFPLLERYLREKSAVHEGNLDFRFYQELLHVFPELKSDDVARQFWKVYRNSLLHQVTTCDKKYNLPAGWLSNDFATIEIDESGNFMVHPAKFAKHVVVKIENDFITFEGCHSVNHPLPVIRAFNIFAGTSAPEVPTFKLPKLSEK